MTDYRFSREDHELLQELAVFAAELRAIAKPRSLYHRVRFWASLAAAMTVNVGIVLAWGGPQRIAINAYRVVADYGGPTWWGAGFIVTGVFTALCVGWWHRALRWALLIEAVPYLAVATSFTVASIRYEDVVLIGTPMFAWVAVLHAFLSDYARKEF